MNVISKLIGIIGLIILVVFLIFPVLGALSSWLALILGIVGLILGAFSSKDTGRTINIVVIIIALVRIFLGGGVL